MCLSRAGELLVAKEDLVCYKRLRPYRVLTQDLDKYHGKEAVAIVRGKEYNVTISIERDRLFLCSNNENLKGRRCVERFGYDYSWIYDSSVTSIKCDEEELVDDSKFKTPYQDAVVTIGETYTSALYKNYSGDVHLGIHSFLRLEDAKNGGSGVFAECFIPKGAEYYKGLYDGAANYASKKLTYVKILE